jgi:RNA polymerase sigma factor (sigma-70 family)
MERRSKLRALAGSALRAQPDRRLVRLAREGQDAAMEEIVRRYRPALVGYAARIVPSHRAEDVVQESLSRAMIALVEDEREIKLKPWLYAIVRNRALNDLRDEHTHEPIPEDFGGASQPQDVAERREEITSLVAAIGTLPDGQRDAIVQRELEGRSHEEIAARLGSTPGAVRGLIFRARLTLRDAAGALLPLPLVRWLLNEASGIEAAAGAGGATAAGGLAAAGAGGGGVAMKSGVTLVVATLAVGSGAALRDDGKRSAAQAADRGAGQQQEGASQSGATADESDSGPGPSSSNGPGGGNEDGDDDNSGPGDGDGDDNSGPGNGDEGDGDNSGPGGGGGAPAAEAGDRSGPGGGGGSGSGGSDSGSSGSGSGDSGSGESGSGSSGSGGSGSGGSGSGGDDPGDDD